MRTINNSTRLSLSTNQLIINQNKLKSKIMKTVELKISRIMATLLILLISATMYGQVDEWNTELIHDSEEALQTMLKQSPNLESFYNESYGYAIFPKVTKAAIAYGGAFGKGIVYKDHQVVGSSKLKQGSVGLQLGGQQYREIIFFKNQESFEKFTNGKLKFDAQVSAVALRNGVSLDAGYQDYVAVFTQTKGGLMYEASFGGQHFKYEPKDN